MRTESLTQQHNSHLSAKKQDIFASFLWSILLALVLPLSCTFYLVKREFLLLQKIFSDLLFPELISMQDQMSMCP